MKEKIMKIKTLILITILSLPSLFFAGEVGNFLTISKNVSKIEATNFVAYKVTDDNPRLLEALEKAFDKAGIKPNNPNIPCLYCTPSLGEHIFKISNDNPRFILKIEEIINELKR